MSVQISYKKQTLFGIIMILLILISIEGISRIVSYQNSCEILIKESEIYSELTDSEIQIMCENYQTIVANRHTPITYLEPNFSSKTVNTNNFGFRGEEIAIEKEKEVFRIFLVGGSTAYGANASSDEKTISGYLKQFLQESIPNQKFEIINAGVPGDWSFQEDQKIKRKILKFEPNLIIIYDGWNELNFNNIEYKEDKLGYYLSYIPQKIQYYYKTPEFISKIIHHLGKQQETDFVSLSNEKVSRWEERHSEICKLGQSKNFMVMIIFQPHLDLGNKPLSEFEKNFKKLSSANC